MDSVITITKNRGRYRAGQELRVLAPREVPVAGAIDRVKASSLVEVHGIAKWGPKAPRQEAPHGS